MNTVVTTPFAFTELVGVKRGPSSSMPIGQAEINDFARLTGDPQWIHIDPARAALTPFGGTIAHGYFTLSLVAHWLSELFPISEAVMSINYGLNRVRFPSPVKVGSTLRMTAAVASCTPAADAAMVEFDALIAANGASKPACAARAMVLFSAAASESSHN